jgi:transposase
VVKFCVKENSYRDVLSAYSEECLSRTSVFNWHKRFKEGRVILQNDQWKGSPSEVVVEKKIVNSTFYKEVIKRLIA